MNAVARAIILACVHIAIAALAAEALTRAAALALARLGFPLPDTDLSFAALVTFSLATFAAILYFLHRQTGPAIPAVLPQQKT